MKNISVFSILLIAGIVSVTNLSYAGTGKVNFGAYTSGSGCSGTGICNTGSATGASVTFFYYQNPDTAGGTFKKVTMMVNYDQAATYGFSGSAEGGTYVFTGGYPFTHSGDQGLGVPSTFAIPVDYVCTYGPKNAQGKITLIVTEFKLH
jgi:hypothetical protein